MRPNPKLAREIAFMQGATDDPALALEVIGAFTRVNTASPPFGLPAEFTLSLPKPLSVNRTRRMDWSAKPKIRAWVRSADNLVRSQGKLPKRISGPYEAIITLPYDSTIDADNTIKGLVDYVRRLELVDNDSPKFMRRLVVEFGDVPTGSKITIRSTGEANATERA